MFKSIRYLIICLMFGLFSFQSKSHALTISANTQYITTGSLLGVFFNANTNQYNYFQLAFEGITSVGNINNGVIDSITMTATLSGGTNIANTGAFVLNANNEWDQILNFSINGTTSANFENMNMSGALAALVQGIGNGFGSISLNGLLDNTNFSASNPNSALGYMPIEANNPHQPWDQFFNLFANNNLAVMIYPLDPTLAGLDAWFYGQQAGTWYDYHVQLSAVPEPTTIGLLFSGLLGGVAARRKKNALIA